MDDGSHPGAPERRMGDPRAPWPPGDDGAEASAPGVADAATSGTPGDATAGAGPTDRVARRRASQRVRRRRLGVLVGLVVLLALGGVVTVGIVFVAPHFKSTTPTIVTTPQQHADAVAESAEDKLVQAAMASVGVRLPARQGAQAPGLPATGFAHPLAPHQVFGFVPYWYLSNAVADVSSLTTVAYFSVGIAADGSVPQSGPGWGDIGDSAFSQLMSAAHNAGDRVLLTVATDDATVLDALSASPATAAAKLVPQVVQLLRANGFDGVDLDLEGRNGADAAGFARFVQLVAAGVHHARAGWEVAIDTYPQSASDPDDFFDVRAIAPSVDQIFVMAYDEYVAGVPSANAPLAGSALSDASALQTYEALVPASKLILGVPFYGDDWTEEGPGTEPGTAEGPVALVYSQIAAGNHPPLWDPFTDTVFISYRYQGKIHQTWYDNALTLALKAALAQQYHAAGVGIWALGMEGSDTGLLSALLGGSPPLKLPLSH
jgi:hypothetical protein